MGEVNLMTYFAALISVENVIQKKKLTLRHYSLVGQEQPASSNIRLGLNDAGYRVGLTRPILLLICHLSNFMRAITLR